MHFHFQSRQKRSFFNTKTNLQQSKISNTRINLRSCACSVAFSFWKRKFKSSKHAVDFSRILRRHIQKLFCFSFPICRNVWLIFSRKQHCIKFIIRNISIRNSKKPRNVSNNNSFIASRRRRSWKHDCNS